MGRERYGIHIVQLHPMGNVVTHNTSHTLKFAKTPTFLIYKVENSFSSDFMF